MNIYRFVDITACQPGCCSQSIILKNALTEANGDIDKAMEIIRKKDRLSYAKRSDREASEGCVVGKKGWRICWVIIALKCETDLLKR